MKCFFLFITLLLLQGCGCNYHKNKLIKKGCWSVETKTDTVFTVVNADSLSEVTNLQPNKDVAKSAEHVLNICDSIIYKYEILPNKNKYTENKRKFKNDLATKCPELPAYSFKSLDNYWSRVTYKDGFFKHEIGRLKRVDTTQIIVNEPAYQVEAGGVFYKNQWFWWFCLSTFLLILKILKR